MFSYVVVVDRSGRDPINQAKMSKKAVILEEFTRVETGARSVRYCCCQSIERSLVEMWSYSSHDLALLEFLR